MMIRCVVTGVLFLGLAIPAVAAAPRAAQNAPFLAFPAYGGDRVLARAVSEEADVASPAAAAGSPSPLPSGTPSAEITAKARAEFDQDRTGKLDRTRYGPQLNGVITDALYAQVSAKLQSLGDVKSFTPVSQTTTHGLTIYVFRVECAKPPAVEETIAWDASGKVVVLAYRPAQSS